MLTKELLFGTAGIPISTKPHDTANGVKHVKALGLEMFTASPCDVVTSVKVPAGLDGAALVKRMRDELGVGIAGGQDELKGKIFRIAHMGYMYEFDLIIAVSALEMMLSTLGYKVELGRGVRALEEEFLKK